MRKWLKRILIVLGGLLGLLIVVLAGAFVYIQIKWDRLYDRPVPVVATINDPETLARGEYIFKYTALC